MDIAIVGGGIAGLSAGYLLNRIHDVTLFEKEDRLGGNACTYVTDRGEQLDIAVAAFGKAGYGDFYALLDQLGISTDLCANSFMSLHNLRTGDGLYLTPSLKGAHTQRFDLLRPRNLKTLMQLWLGLRKAQKMSARGELAGRTLEEALAMRKEISGDARLILVCTLCLLSSMSASEVLASPADFFLEKLRVHDDVISPRAIYSVRCVSGGTKMYIDALAAAFRDRVELGADVTAIVRDEQGVELVMGDGRKQRFGAVVLACNADQALALLDDPTERERTLLGAWRYKEGTIVVHRGHGEFPARDLIQAYTFLYTKDGGELNTSVNGALWHEPQVSDSVDYISTQHPNYDIRPDLIETETTLRTPIFDFDSHATVSALPSLNGVRNTYYCGSHFGHGLHADAVSSAVRVAEMLGVPFVAPERQKVLPVLRQLFSK